MFRKIGFMLQSANLIICHLKSSYVQIILKRFDRSWKLQNEGYYKDCQISRRLLPGSIPTLLPHKKDNRPCLSSEKRVLAQRKEEVIYCFNKVVPQSIFSENAGPQTAALLKKRTPSMFFSKILSKFPKLWLPNIITQYLNQHSHKVWNLVKVIN